MSIDAPGRRSAGFADRIIGRPLDRLLDAAHNPWHQLGALGFFLFWIVAVTGFYVYALFETSATGAWSSVERMSARPWHVAGLMRSVHRYASDAFVIVMFVHLLRELLRMHWRGFRTFSWVSGVPLVWLAYASGIGGYWLVWDQLALFSITATAEWLAWLPLGSQAIVRNFLYAIDDRFFSLLIFLHIGIPLILLAGMWIHIQRISRVRTLPTRALGAGVMAMLLVAAITFPVRSHAPADPSLLETVLALDWILMFPHALQYWSSEAVLWAMAGGFTLLLAVLPLFSGKTAAPIARVDPRYCNGCERCVDDCPYAAIVMRPRADGRGGQRIPAVDPDACAACGICAGACPSSTPFRSTDALVTGIDLPDLAIAALRARLEAGLSRRTGQGGAVVVFACERAADGEIAVPPGTVRLPLRCIGMLPPSFIEYALRAGAHAVLVNACRPGECEFRLGPEWIEARASGTREPHLRASVDRDRIHLTRFGLGEERPLAAAVRVAAMAEHSSASTAAAPKRQAVRHE